MTSRTSQRPRRSIMRYSTLILRPSRLSTTVITRASSPTRVSPRQLNTMPFTGLTVPASRATSPRSSNSANMRVNSSRSAGVRASHSRASEAAAAPRTSAMPVTRCLMRATFSSGSERMAGSFSTALTDPKNSRRRSVAAPAKTGVAAARTHTPATAAVSRLRVPRAKCIFTI